MWPFCNANNPAWLLLPFLIGLATGWWAWWQASQRPVRADYTDEYAELEETDVPMVHHDGVQDGQSETAPLLLDDVDVSGSQADASTALTAIGIPAAKGAPDDLRRIKGIGPSLNALLLSLGVTRFDQISEWGADDIAKVDGRLGSFTGRIDRDSWVEQARLLAIGAFAEFEHRFGSINSET